MRSCTSTHNKEGRTTVSWESILQMWMPHVFRIWPMSKQHNKTLDIVEFHIYKNNLYIHITTETFPRTVGIGEYFVSLWQFYAAYKRQEEYVHMLWLITMESRGSHFQRPMNLQCISYLVVVDYVHISSIWYTKGTKATNCVWQSVFCVDGVSHQKFYFKLFYLLLQISIELQHCTHWIALLL